MATGSHGAKGPTYVCLDAAIQELSYKIYLSSPIERFYQPVCWT